MPQPLLPNQPPGMPDWYSPSGFAPTYGSPVGSASPSGGTRPRFYATANGPVTLPSDWTDEDARQWVQGYDQYIAKLTQQWEQSSGLQRKQIESQIEDAKKARENAMEIARLQDRTSRYGTDVGSRDRMAALMQEDQHFQATHGLDMQRLGLDRAKTATDYLSTPDRFVQANDFLDLSGRVLANQGGAGNNAYHVMNAAKAIYSMNLNPQQQASINSSPEYKSILGSAGRRQGRNPDEWWQTQQQSLPGQGAANSYR